ncbi:MAG: helix-hairpin-helix domain-containing protein, partial [Acidobacteriota bacterium]|nr:helix-hairpin-helix domain-containing protein [Acidobacteriota bacterium]
MVRSVVKDDGRKPVVKQPQLIDIPGVGSRTAEKLTAFGFTSVAHVARGSITALRHVPGIGARTAVALRRRAAAVLAVAGQERDSASKDSEDGVTASRDDARRDGRVKERGEKKSGKAQGKTGGEGKRKKKDGGKKKKRA